MDECIAGLDEGTLRVAERRESGWAVNQWLKQAVLLSFRLNDNRVIEGGYTLAKNPENVTLASVIRVIDGPIAPVPCLSRTAYRRCDGCKDEATCGVRLVLPEAYGASVQVLESTTLADMARRLKEATRESLPVLRYSI